MDRIRQDVVQWIDSEYGGIRKFTEQMRQLVFLCPEDRKHWIEDGLIYFRLLYFTESESCVQYVVENREDIERNCELLDLIYRQTGFLFAKVLRKTIESYLLGIPKVIQLSV